MASNKAADGGQSFEKDGGHLLAAQITRRKDKGGDSSLQQSGEFGRPVPDARVFGQDDPSSLSHFRKPFLIACSWRKEFVVHLHFNIRLTKCVGDRLFSEIPVEKKDERFRRLRAGARTGSLPRFPAA